MCNAAFRFFLCSVALHVQIWTCVVIKCSAIRKHSFIATCVLLLQGRSMPPKLYRAFEEQDSEIGAKLSGNTERMLSCEEILMVVHPDKGNDMNTSVAYDLS